MLKFYILSVYCLIAFVLSIIFLVTHTDDNKDNTKDNKVNKDNTDNTKDNTDNTKDIKVNKDNTDNTGGSIVEWTDDFKNSVIILFPKKLNFKCTNCIINSLEKIVEPDIQKVMRYIQNDHYMTNLALQNCKHECT
jgi:hypothetical protein